MATPLRVLIVEDSEDDSALILRELRRAGYVPAFERVETEAALREALRRPWDVVLSDYTLPEFSGPEALRIVKESGLDLPFIMISGTIGEETAVEAMRSGADDYLMKGRLARLAPALERELHDAADRRARRRAEAGLARRDEILKAMVASGEQLLRSRNWRRSIQEVLERLGQAIGVSRLYLFENEVGEDGEPVTSQRYEWVAPGVSPLLANPALQRFAWRAGGLGRWEEILRRGQTIHVHKRELPPEEREHLVDPDVRSLALVPIFVGEAWWGFIGFDDCTDEREWSTAELDALKTAADTLGAAIQRGLVQEQVERQVQRLAGLRAINVAITASLDLGVTLNVFLDHATAQLGVDAADVLLFRPHSRTLEYAAGRGLRTGALQRTSLRVGEGYAGRVALERRPLNVADLAAETGPLGRSELLRDEGFAAYYAMPLISKGQLKGVLEVFHRSPLELTPEWLDFAHTLAGQAAVAIDNALLFEDLQRSNLELMMAYDTTLEGWSRALDLRDHETEGHTQRVTELTLRLARALGMSDAELVHVRRGALLHDIGKMGIPDSILLKPGPLTDEEWKVMRLHPVYAHDLLAPVPFLRPALDIPYCHHEKWDGTGYPRGLRGYTIPLAARVFAIVDVWDALSSDRPYRKAWTSEQVYDHVRGLSGTHFDPPIVEAFLFELFPSLDASSHDGFASMAAQKAEMLPAAGETSPGR